MAFIHNSLAIVAILPIFLLIHCSAESVSSHSARWDNYRSSKRLRRDTPTMEWQDRNDFPTCTLTDISTHDALGRRASGLLATPQNQGSCGSCWAFAATHVFTDTLSISSGSRVSVFSPDYLTQCISPFRRSSQAVGNGCCGGNAYYAFTYFYLVGAVSETCVPYTLEGYIRSGRYKRANPLVCPRSCTNSGSTFNPASNRIPGATGLQNEEAVISALDQGRTVYAAMEVRNDFFSYKCGVFCDVPIVDVNHAVEIVDYSSDSFPGSPYWVVKNSWGDTWGEEGYFRIARGRNQLTSFVALTGSAQTSPPDEVPTLLAQTCNAQEPDGESDNELIESAAEFAIKQLNNRREIRCADNRNTVATLSLSSVTNGTVQIVEGSMVEVTARVNVGGCSEDTATVTLVVAIDMEDNFSFVEYNNYAVIPDGDENGGSRAITYVYIILVMSAFATLFA